MPDNDSIALVRKPVGESVTRIEAREKVTGSATFADDFQFGPGLLYAAYLAQSSSARPYQEY